MIYEIDKMESDRIASIRAICIIMIIFLHQYSGNLKGSEFAASGTLPDDSFLRGIQFVISRIITFSAVPMYFLISSVLLYAKEFSWKDNIKKKIKTIILPYFIWMTIYILIYFIGQTLPMTSTFFQNTNRKVINMNGIEFIGAYTGLFGNQIFVNALWFLRDLFLLNIIAPIIKRIIDRFPYISLTLILILWTIGTIPEFLIFSKQSIVFFCLGYFVVKYNLRMKQVDRLHVLNILLVYIISISLEYYYHLKEFRLAEPLHSITVIIGMLLTIKATKYTDLTQKSKIILILKSISRYSFFIYVSHDFLQTVLKKIMEKIFQQSDGIQTIEYFVIPFFVCFLGIVIAMLFQKLSPTTYSFLSGYRKQNKIYK